MKKNPSPKLVIAVFIAVILGAYVVSVLPLSMVGVTANPVDVRYYTDDPPATVNVELFAEYDGADFELLYNRHVSQYGHWTYYSTSMYVSDISVTVSNINCLSISGEVLGSSPTVTVQGVTVGFYGYDPANNNGAVYARSATVYLPSIAVPFNPDMKFISFHVALRDWNGVHEQDVTVKVYTYAAVRYQTQPSQPATIVIENRENNAVTVAGANNVQVAVVPSGQTATVQLPVQITDITVTLPDRTVTVPVDDGDIVTVQPVQFSSQSEVTVNDARITLPTSYGESVTVADAYSVQTSTTSTQQIPLWTVGVAVACIAAVAFYLWKKR